MEEKQDKARDLTTKQRRAATALVTLGTVRAAAGEVNVTDRTVSRWLQLPAMQAAVRQAEEASLDESTRRLVSLTAGATSVIIRILQSDKATDAIKLKAAALVLHNVVKLRELRQVEERLTTLEEVLL